MTNTLLEKAIQLALNAHQGQLDKSGQTYILHPLRLMLKMNTIEEQIVAVLHDVVEDSQTTFDDLRQLGFNDTIINALDCVTRRDDETYEEFVLRSKDNPVARKVKLADLEDNMNVQRLSQITEEDAKRLQRYLKAWQLLKDE